MERFTKLLSIRAGHSFERRSVSKDEERQKKEKKQEETQTDYHTVPVSLDIRHKGLGTV